jgi:1,4-alpha-glucan branching enzyme
MQPRYAPQSNTLDRPAAPAKAKPSTARSAEKSETKPHQSRQKPVEFVLHVPQASSVAVAGSFNGWDLNKTPMQKEGNGWKAKLSLAPGRYEYRFVVDGQWTNDPNAKECVRNDFGSTNSILVV